MGEDGDLMGFLARACFAWPGSGGCCLLSFRSLLSMPLRCSEGSLLAIRNRRAEFVAVVEFVTVTIINRLAS